MRDINGDEFQVGDTLKVVKGGWGFDVGDLVVCSHDDDSECCEFYKLGEDPEDGACWVNNNRLQKI